MDKKTNLYYIGLFIAGVICGYLLCGYYLPVDGTTSSEWAARLSTAKRDNENLKDELKRSTAAVTESNRRTASLEAELRKNGERLDRAEASARYANRILQDNDQLILEAGGIAEHYQQLFSGIQQADKSQDKKP